MNDDDGDGFHDNNAKYVHSIFLKSQGYNGQWTTGWCCLIHCGQSFMVFSSSLAARLRHPTHFTVSTNPWPNEIIMLCPLYSVIATERIEWNSTAKRTHRHMVVHTPNYNDEAGDQMAQKYHFSILYRHPFAFEFTHTIIYGCWTHLDELIHKSYYHLINIDVWWRWERTTTMITTSIYPLHKPHEALTAFISSCA